ncbi:hypothetical protein P154DRAFT_573481 [Amniculicola lignicola CBS 123094]|uniref:RING-type domain-containing protein n=1 Tax=Amniculicola lignicola CBS 123094 TaxID=1392246 RepID=A0A6A5WSC0_9PLEO|nr:hypothetical protein P154DRAFT_573481 [Amniculicola lignicola CBS 123094]
MASTGMTQSRENFIHSLISVSIDSIPADDSKCSICHEEWSTDDSPVRIPTCRHVFGRDCLLKWIGSTSSLQSNTCPLDRSILFTVTSNRSSLIVIRGGEVIVANNRITREGIRLYVQDLSSNIRRLRQQELNEMLQNDQSIKEEARRPLLPIVRVSRVGWERIEGVVRRMVSDHRERVEKMKCQQSQEILGESDLVVYVECLLDVFRDDLALEGLDV